MGKQRRRLPPGKRRKTTGNTTLSFSRGVKQRENDREHHAWGVKQRREHHGGVYHEGVYHGGNTTKGSTMEGCTTEGTPWRGIPQRGVPRREHHRGEYHRGVYHEGVYHGGNTMEGSTTEGCTTEGCCLPPQQFTKQQPSHLLYCFLFKLTYFIKNF